MNRIQPGEATVTQLQDMVNRLDICMLITCNAEGQRTNRPIAVIKMDENGYCWFFASRLSGKLKDISGNKNIDILFADLSSDAYVEIHGVASVTCDIDEIKNKWSPLAEQWFPKGITDPEVCLVRVKMEHVFYWDTATKKIQRLELKIDNVAEASSLAA